jgi:hypothetical protein
MHADTDDDTPPSTDTDDDTPPLHTVVPKAKAKSKAAAKGNPKAKAQSKPAAKAYPTAKAESKPAANAVPKKVTTRKSASASNSSASASIGPSRRPAAAMTEVPQNFRKPKGKTHAAAITQVPQHFRKPKGKKHVIKEVKSLSAKTFKPNKLSGYDKMAEICRPVVRKRAHEETQYEEEVDLEEEEGGEEEGLCDDRVVNPDTFAHDSITLDKSKTKEVRPASGVGKFT